MNPDKDPGGPKTYESYGTGSATLEKNIVALQNIENHACSRKTGLDGAVRYWYCSWIHLHWQWAHEQQKS
jgi:hypothetical protein